MGIDFADLWLGMRRGDKQAMKQLYQAFYARLYSFAFRYSADHDKAQDVIHELFCELWESRERLNPVANVYAYLITSIKHKLTRDLRRENLYDTLKIADEQLLVEYPYESLLIASQVSEQNKERIAAALARLSKMQLQVITMRFFQNLSYAEIANRLGLKERTVYNHASMAMAALRVILQPASG